MNYPNRHGPIQPSKSRTSNGGAPIQVDRPQSRHPTPATSPQPRHFLANLNKSGLGFNGAPMGLQWGEIGKRNLGDVLDFLCCQSFCLVLWDLYYSKMANQGHILQCVLDDFWNFDNFVKIRTRRPPNDHQHILKHTTK